MPLDPFVLEGRHVRLEPLELHHAEALVAASDEDPLLYQWTFVPRDVATAKQYIETALAWRDAGHALAFATVRKNDGVMIGSTRFFALEHWPWPQNSPHFDAHTFDIGEIGYTWLAASAVRTAVNTEAKLLMLTHAFETWKTLCMYLSTDERNKRSAAAIARLGAKFEGILRCQRMGADFTPRNSARFSIVAEEWPEVKQRLKQRLLQ